MYINICIILFQFIYKLILLLSSTTILGDLFFDFFFIVFANCDFNGANDLIVDTLLSALSIVKRLFL